MKTISAQSYQSAHRSLGLLIAGWLLTAALTPESWAINNSNVTFSGITTNFAGVLYWPTGDAGTNNVLTITNAAKVGSAQAWIGFTAGVNSNSVVVTGPGSTWSNSYTSIGHNGSGNHVTVTDGAFWLDTGSSSTFVGLNATANNNSILVTANALFQSKTTLEVGSNGSSNLVTVSDGGTMSVAALLIGQATGIGNRVVVTNGGKFFCLGNGIIGGNIPGGSTSYDTWLNVVGTGSVYSNTGNFLVGRYSGRGNHVTVADGGLLINLGTGYIGGIDAVSSNNTGLVTGPGSIWYNLNSTLVVGTASASNSLTVANGGLVSASVMQVGNTGISGNQMLLTNGGVLEANTLSVYSGNTISNNGGVYQFTSASPIVSAGRVFLTNGVVSFRGVANADVYSDVSGTINGITYQGNNTFRLNNSSNATGVAAYTFDTGLNPDPALHATNYAGLELVNGTTLWRSGALVIGPNGGSLLVSNTVASIAAVVTNQGRITVVNSSVTFASNVVNSGRYIADPSTSTFSNDLTVTRSGTLEGTPGDVFDFKKSLLIQSTNNLGFNLASSVVSFSGGGNHTNAVTGGDFGTNLAVYPNANFSYGTLTLASATDQLYFVSGGFTNGLAGSNALYVTQLNLFNNSGALDTGLVANLHSPFNIYYLNLENNSGNAYLNDTIFPLSGGGSLMPFVPEPSTLALVALAACAILRRRSVRT